MKIGELARQSGVSPDTIRHYERLGLLPGITRTEGGFRVYGPEATRRLRLVRRAMVFGFTLSELRAYLGDRDRGEAPCRQVRAAAAKKLDDVEAQLRELRTLRAAMRKVLADWDEALLDARPGEAVRLLDSLPHVAARTKPRRGMRGQKK